MQLEEFCVLEKARRVRGHHAHGSWSLLLVFQLWKKDLGSLEMLTSAWHPAYVIAKYDDKREEGWMAAQKVLREMETKFISWQTEIHLFILSRSKRYEEWTKSFFCWEREIHIIVFGHNTKPEADLNTLRKQNSGLRLKGKNKQFTFHSALVQTKLRNGLLWQGQCMRNKTKQNYRSGVVGSSGQSLVLIWLLQGKSPRQSSEHRCTANIALHWPNELVKIQKDWKRKWKQNKRDIPAVYILLFQDVYFYREPFSLTSKQFIFKYFFWRGATLVVGFSSKHMVFSLCLVVRLHVWYF